MLTSQMLRQVLGACLLADSVSRFRFARRLLIGFLTSQLLRQYILIHRSRLQQARGERVTGAY